MADKQSTLAKLPASPVIAGFLILLIVGFLGAAFNAYYVLRHTGYDQRYLELTGELRVSSQQIATAARESTAGKAASFDTLNKTQKTFDKQLQTLVNGGDSLPSPKDLLGNDLTELS